MPVQKKSGNLSYAPHILMTFLIKKTVFSILNEHNLKISATKSVFNVTSLDFFGFHIRVNGIKAPISKIEELKSFPYPKDAKGLRKISWNGRIL